MSDLLIIMCKLLIICRQVIVCRASVEYIEGSVGKLAWGGITAQVRNIDNLIPLPFPHFRDSLNQSVNLILIRINNNITD